MLGLAQTRTAHRHARGRPALTSRRRITCAPAGFSALAGCSGPTSGEHPAAAFVGGVRPTKSDSRRWRMGHAASGLWSARRRASDPALRPRSLLPKAQVPHNCRRRSRRCQRDRATRGGGRMKRSRTAAAGRPRLDDTNEHGDPRYRAAPFGGGELTGSRAPPSASGGLGQTPVGAGSRSAASRAPASVSARAAVPSMLMCGSRASSQRGSRQVVGRGARVRPGAARSARRSRRGGRPRRGRSRTP